MKPLYEVLGVAQDATQAQIKAAYRKLAKKHHPDKGGDEAMFKQIQNAYDILGDVERRAKYDHNGFTGNGAEEESRRVSQLVGLITQIIDSTFSLERSNIFDMARRHLKEDISKCNTRIRSNDKAIEKRRIAADRISRKEGHNFLVDALNNQIEKLEENSAEVRYVIEETEVLINMLDDYEYRTDGSNFWPDPHSSSTTPITQALPAWL